MATASSGVEAAPLDLQCISADVDLVLLADVAAQSRLSALIDAWPPPNMEVRNPIDFLHSYDMVSLAGESRRRELERLFAGLRGKMVVRLVVANLNPESIERAGGHCPLTSTLNDWKKIHARQKQLLSERECEGMSFATIVIAEEGDWRPEHEALLLSLAKGQADNGELPGRCYLMSRKLELGARGVLHTTDLWPFYVRSLLHHLVDQKQAGAFQSASDSGLFGWRSLIVNVDPGSEAIAEHFGKALQRLLSGRPSSPALDMNALKYSLPDLSITVPSPDVVSPFLSGGWRELPTRAQLDRFTDQATWTTAAENDWDGEAEEQGVALTLACHMQAARDKLSEWLDRLWASIAREPFKTSVSAPQRISQAQTTSADQLGGIATLAANAEKMTRELLDWYQQHNNALRYFLPAGHRIGIFLALTGAMGFSTVVLMKLVASIAGIPLGQSMLVVSSIVGMMLLGMGGVLLLTSWLQKRALVHAYKKLRIAADQLGSLRGEIELSKSRLLAESQLRNGFLNTYLKACEVYSRCLGNLQQMIQSLELQGLDMTRSTVREAAATRHDWLSKVQILVRTPGISQSVSEDVLDYHSRYCLDQWLSQQSWMHLTKTARACGLVPSMSIHGLMQQFQDSLRSAVRTELLNSTKDGIESNIKTNASHLQALSERVAAIDFFSREHASRPNLFSVDVEQGALKTRCWAEEWFFSVLPDGEIDERGAIGTRPLPAGTLAVVFSEARLQIDSVDEVLRFKIDAEG